VNYPGDDHSSGRRGFQYRALPLWLQWFLPFAVAAVVVLALVLFVHYETNDTPAIAAYNSAAAVREQSREDAILVRQQQAPHHTKLATGQSAAVGLRRSIVAWMTHQINIGSIDGPIKRTVCQTVTGGTSGRRLFHCDLTASAQSVTYPFDGVVQSPGGAITWCQRVAPPIPSMNVPLSKLCT
jgi:hypothetical protein